MHFMDVVKSEKVKRGEIVELDIPEQLDINISNVDIFQSVVDTLERVWLALTDYMQEPLKDSDIPEWVDTLRWAIKVIPIEYERPKTIIRDELGLWVNSKL